MSLARLRGPLLAAAFPLLALAGWHLATHGRAYSLIPPPWEVGQALWDLAFGGINDDAFSETLLTHALASMSRVYGGFGLAALVALPLGMLIGRVPVVRAVLDPTLQLLRPVPVTAWLLVVEALPTRFSVPPPSTRDEPLLRMFVEGAPLAVKSRARVPLLTVVAPV